jgi:hypothetical protein
VPALRESLDVFEMEPSHREPPTSFVSAHRSIPLHHCVEVLMALFEDNLGCHFASRPLRDLVINAEA